MARKFKIQLRRGTAATWTATNPTLAEGEAGFETDTGSLKIGDGSTAWNSLGYATGGSGAPTGADYLVGTANGGLSAEIVVGTTPGGELGGTWASPTVDATHSGSAHHDPVTVGTGLDVTGQLVELDLSEVAAGGELGGFMDAPTVDSTHSGSTHAGAAAAETADIRGVDVLVGTATAAFSGEIVVGTSPGGELGGTWASPTVDATHSGSAHHSAVTLGSDADVLLGLTGQQIDFDTQTANTVLAGPTTGAAADPTFRALVAADLPSTLTGLDFLVGTATGVLSAEIVAGTAPGGELGGSWASPTVDTNHGGEYMLAAADIAINDTNYVTIASQAITFAAGQKIIVEMDGLILNNSGGTKTYTVTLDIGGVLVECSDGSTIGTSATNHSPFEFRGGADIQATNLAYLWARLIRHGPTAANTVATIAGLSNIRGTWNSTTNNLTGAQTVIVKIKSSNATATQTLRRFACRMRVV